jgi:hypothetical protein
MVLLKTQNVNQKDRIRICFSRNKYFHVVHFLHGSCFWLLAFNFFQMSASREVFPTCFKGYCVCGGVRPWVPMAQDMGCTIRDGPAHDIKTCGTRHWSACTARHLEDISKIWFAMTLIEVVIQIEYLPYNRLGYFPYNPTPPEYIRSGRGPLVDSYMVILIKRAQDVGFYVILTAWTCINLVSCVSVTI